MGMRINRRGAVSLLLAAVTAGAAGAAAGPPITPRSVTAPVAATTASDSAARDSAAAWRRFDDLVDEVVVSATRETRAPLGPAVAVTTTAASLQRLEGVDLVRRGNFGFDPAIRGTRPSQAIVVIDGMKVFNACVDRMDPVTAYVETENLERLEITRGGFDLTHGAAAGGTVNLVTSQPRFGTDLSARTRVGFESAARHRFARTVVEVSRPRWAARGSYAYRRAADLHAGGGERLARSQFAKYNYKLDLTGRAGSHRVAAGLLADEAWDVGYPALLMDARRARSRLYSLTHTWSPDGRHLHSLETRLYLSAVHHWMDDDDRDVTGREVMRDMHMPMFGRTHTWGLLQTLQLAGRRQTLELVLDAYRLRAFADMRMVPLDPAVASMYLLNLGDVDRRHAALTADYRRQLGSGWQVRLDLRVDGVDQDLHDPQARRQLAATWGETRLGHRFGVLSGSGVLTRRLGPAAQVSLAWADQARVPTHVESYGFYLYNPADGYFYTGQPRLQPERSRQVEVSWRFEDEDRLAEVRLHHTRFRRYVAGLEQEGPFKTYRNIPRARLLGGEARFAWTVVTGLRLHGGGAYTYGRNDSFHEPLPWVPPLAGRLGVQGQRGAVTGRLDTRWVARQSRVASRTTLEDETPGFVTVDLGVRLGLGRGRRLDLGVDNALDRRYHEHLSVGDFPSPGRNLTVALDLAR